MTNIQKFTVAKCFQSAIFWMAIVAFFFGMRGFTPEQVYLLFSIYSLSMVIFEYPTGIIADRLSYKGVLSLGTILQGITTIMLAVTLPFEWLILVICSSAFFGTLASGSDDALLHHISKDFKKDYAHIRFLSLLASAAAVSLGGFIYKFSPSLPFILSGIFAIIAGFVFLSIKDSRKGVKDGVDTARSIAVEGLVHVFRKKILLLSILFASFVSAVMISIKWVVPTFFDKAGLSPELFSTALAVSTILLAIGSKMSTSKKYGMRLSYSVAGLVFSIAMLGVPYGWIVIGVMMSAYFFHGYAGVEMTNIINYNALDKARASIMSIKSLGERLIASIYVLLVGFLLNLISPMVLMLGVGLLLGFISFGVVLRVKHSIN